MRVSALLFLTMMSCRTGDKVAQSDTAGLTDPASVDADGDGFSADEDCDDGDASINAGAVEVCDGLDNNCDGEVDEGVELEGFEDADGDSFGDPEASVQACELGQGVVANANDCDDGDAAVFPGAIEVCNGIDDDCDNEVDEELLQTFYADVDEDGFGDADTAVDACEAPSGFVTDGTDCDDAAASVWPGAVEVCNEIDDDCDEQIDEGVTTTYTLDQDGDGFGGTGGTVEACDVPLGYAADTGDCDDADVAYFPGAPETDCADPNDYNCDGSVAYADADGDGWAACEECDDTAFAVNPDAVEVCDSIDNDCDGDIDDADSGLDTSTADTWYADTDADSYGDAASTTLACAQPAGFVADSTDCDDTATAVHPGAIEICDNIDNDCDGDIDDDDASLDTSTATAWYADTDTDGYGDSASASLACDQPSGTVANDGDCDDGDVAINPLATELCDTIDNDCDGDIDDADIDVVGQTAWYADADTDGYGSSTSATTCFQPTGYVSTSTDCDDTNIAINPGATEVCDGVDNDCDTAVDEGLTTVTTTFANASPSGSCNGNANRSVTFNACNCSAVTLTGSFLDNSDGSQGQLVGVSTATSGMTLTWDDAPSGGDCDLDIRSAISWSTSYSSGTLTINVTDQITGYSAGNSLSAGYSMTGYSTYRRGSGSGTRSFTYSCN